VRPLATVLVWSVCLSVGHIMSCAKTDELIKMSFKMWTETGPEKHGLGGKGNVEGISWPIVWPSVL